MLLPAEKHLIKRQHDLHDDEDHDLQLHAQAATVLHKVDGGLDGAADHIELRLDGFEAVRDFKFVVEAGKWRTQKLKGGLPGLHISRLGCREIGG